jgi:hypothetical protein
MYFGYYTLAAKRMKEGATKTRTMNVIQKFRSDSVVAQEHFCQVKKATLNMSKKTVLPC